MNEEVEDAFRTENENVHYQKGCYCGENKESETLRCMSCHRCLHSDCLKTGLPTPLEGDIYFDVTCSECASDGDEMCKRAYMSWTQAVYLALYNLSICTSGRKGYFRWKEDICQFLERNWMLLFPGRKRTTSWCSTVAGTLSIGCPQYFKSGLKQFKENGWWALADKVPPVVKLGNPGSEQKRKKNSNKSSKKRKTQVESLPMREQNTKEEKEDKKKIDPSYEEHDDQLLESLLSGDAVTMDTESDEVIASLLAQEEEQSLEVSAKSLFPFMEVDDPCTLISDVIKDEWNANVEINQPIRSQDDSHISEGNNDSGNESDRAESLASTIKSEVKKPSKMKQSNEQDIAAESIRNRLVKISEDDEHEVLCRLNACTEAIQKDCKARRLKRKLILRKIKRENGLPLFDLDAFINKSLSSTKCYVFKDGDFVSSKKDEVMYDTAEKKKEQEGYQQRKSNIFTRYSRVLDRFLAAPQMLRRRDQQVPTFLSRLVGVDRQTLLRHITSPYTARVLKPFIRRDFESRPLKLRLLDEIKNYPHRKDPSWKAAPPSYSIDYCYVQPYHIPAVNTMCREFFWPGIDLSESLQYPDFSCVVLFRSLVIGFAFMVPDVKYNEAYISFILVHPEWRRAGIGTYMLYHLIQTCMGKDVTLHVSVTNQAMLMYQKFGFKPEEFILDFYEKYLPENSLECRHAFFLRLRR